MAETKVSLLISAGVDDVWDALTDPDKECLYWTNVRDIKVLSRSGNTIQREATVGPSGFRQKTKQSMTVDPKRSIKLLIYGESITGERMIVASPQGDKGTKVEVSWNLRLKGVPRFVDGIVSGQIANVTEGALVKIAETVERNKCKDGVKEAPV